MKRVLIGIVAVAIVAVAADKSQDAERQLKAAMNVELVDGNLKAAIEQYKKVAQSSNRPIAAQALLHMAECYQKLGDADAHKIYQQIVTLYADQKAAVAMAQSHLSGAKANSMVNRPVWGAKNASYVGSVSPDGRYVTFIDWDNKNHNDLVLHELATGIDRRLTKASKDEFPDESAFSPDGKQIAYIWYDSKGEQDFRILSLTGANDTARIFKNADWEYDTVAWSPDGKSVAVYAGPKGKPLPIAILSLQNGSWRTLPSVANSGLYFSPDGKYLAYDRLTNGRGSQKDIFIVAVDSGREIPAVVWPSEDSVMGWSRDGRLLFASDRNGSMDLFAQSFSDGKPQGQSTLVKAGIGNVWSVGMTSSGSLFYSLRSSGPQQYLEIAPFDFATGKVLSSSIAVGQPAQQLQVVEQYDWSPDGKYFAYTTPNSGANGRGPAIVIRSTETGQSRLLLSGSVPLNANVRWAPDSRTLLATAPNRLYQIDTQTDRVSTFDADATVGPGVLIDMPRWSPDQKKIYFRRPTNGSVAFFESDPDLKNAREIIRRPTMGGLNLTPDGRTIITAATGEGGPYIAIPVGGGGPRQLHSSEAGNIFISPDGKYVALVLATPAPDRKAPALLLPIGGGQPRELLNATPLQSVSMGMWAPDSKSIFLKKSLPDGQQAEIWRVPVDGGQAVKVDMGLNLDQITRGFGVSPKGDQIAFIRGTKTPAKSEIWVLESFLPAVGANK